jgi:hypothetical protein
LSAEWPIHSFPNIGCNEISGKIPHQEVLEAATPLYLAVIVGDEIVDFTFPLLT